MYGSEDYSPTTTTALRWGSILPFRPGALRWCQGIYYPIFSPHCAQVGQLPSLSALNLVGPFRLEAKTLSDNAEHLSGLTRLCFEGR